jgi:MoaA/NifB/PqqE/SkfB family radical SAM enzyme
MKILNPIAVIRRRKEEADAIPIQCTWDPMGPGVIRLHLVPPRQSWDLRRHASLLHINGQHIIPLNHGNAALLRIFMQELSGSAVPNEEVSEEQMRGILERTASKMHYLYPEESKDRFIGDLGRLQNLIQRVAFGQPVPELEGKSMTLAEYAPHMRAPFRMDLAVAPMRINDVWACPNACVICYAATGEAMQVTWEEQLTTDEWREVIDRLWKAGVVQVSFTGGDPLARPDIVELVAHAQEFTTRLNTSAVLLTEEVARELHAAQLDVMQVTVYSYIQSVHDKLVGRVGAFQETMRGLRIAIKAGIEVSVNTPLVVENVEDYADTISFLHDVLGVRYFTASGMLPAGGAKKKIAAGGAAPQDVLYRSLQNAKHMAFTLDCELDITSPGSLTDDQIKSLGMNIPTCGACLGNMAIAPDGEVLPCQSWVHQKKILGNILTVPWNKIWDHPTCKRIRQTATFRNECPLANEGGVT